MSETANGWENRIVGSGAKPADQFVSNPSNPRRHPQEQRDAVEGSLNELGWVAPVIENVRTGYLLDGHERVWQALRRDNAEVPYIQVDLSEKEEELFLASFDYITQMAYYDADILGDLLQTIETNEVGLQALLDEMANSDHIYSYDNGDNEDDYLYSRKIESPLADCRNDTGGVWRVTALPSLF